MWKRFDYGAFAIGVLVAASVFVAVAVSVDWRGIRAVCRSDENWVVCVREWTDVVAIAGGFFAVIFVSAQIAQSRSEHREAMALNTLAARRRYIRFGNRNIAKMREVAPLIAAAREFFQTNKDADPGVVLLHVAILRSHLDAETWEQILEYDNGTVSDARDGAISSAYMAWDVCTVPGTPLNTDYNSVWKFMRNRTNDFGAADFGEKQFEYLDLLADSVLDLADKTQDLIAGVQTLGTRDPD